MTVKQQTLRSHVAAVGYAPMLRERMQKADKKGLGLQVLGYGAALVPVVGVPISYLLDRRRTVARKNAKLDELTNFYRFQVAQTLRMNPDNVTSSDLELAAKQNPILRQAIEKVNAEARDANRSATLSNGAIWALTGWNPIPGVGLAGVLAKDLVLGAAASKVSDFFSNDILHVHDMVEYIDAKSKAGNPQDPVTAKDIMLLRAAQDENWQMEVKKRWNISFHKMSEQTQRAVLESMPLQMQNAEKEAYALNKGLVSVQSLVMQGATSDSSYADSVIQKAMQGSYQSTESARRLAAAQQQNQATLN